MDSPRLTYSPHPDTTPEAEVNALASVYRFLLLEKGGQHDLTHNAVMDGRKQKVQGKARKDTT
jgi:hypothetical protein